MESRSIALKLVAEAVQLDSNGFSQAAFAKYIQSLQALAVYLNEMFASQGFEKMMDNNRETKHVLSMIHECSDRLTAISDKTVEPPSQSSSTLQTNSSVTIRKSRENLNLFRLPGVERLQNENMTLLKTYQWRFERAKDNYARTNLKLELERRLAENDILAKKKFNLAVKQLQKERASVMEQEMKKLFGNHQILNESEREKRDLFASVFEYTKTETWPCTSRLNSWEISDAEAVERVFDVTMRCSNHPLSQWIVMMKTNIKRDVDTTLKLYSHLQRLLPSTNLNSDEDPYRLQEFPDELCFQKDLDSEKMSIPKHNLETLHKALHSISSEIMYTIGCVVDVFYLTYKSLLPLDSEEICLSLVEQCILKPIWPNLIVLYRIENIVAEFKIAEVMRVYKNPKPSDFGITTQRNLVLEMYDQCSPLLKSLNGTESLVGKLKILVQVSQIICGSTSHRETSQRNRIGADEFMPLLSYILVETKLPHLSSECYAIEQLFDVKFMFGEEGYALSSFLTAFKYIEMKQLIDGENSTSKRDEE